MNDETLWLDIWSDIACPWCYVGKRRLEAALARFPQRDSVEVDWHAFELDPGAPRQSADDLSTAERLARKYGMSNAQAEERLAQMTQLAAGDGLELHFERSRAANTFDGHRLIRFAATHALQGAMKERLLRAYFTEGERVDDPEVLARLAVEVGLDSQAVRAMLASDAGAKEVREDEARARKLGIDGVPFFVIGGRYGISGAQPAEVLLEALERAWSEARASGERR